jgi:hypothetical protein
MVTTTITFMPCVRGFAWGHSHHESDFGQQCRFAFCPVNAARRVFGLPSVRLRACRIPCQTPSWQRSAGSRSRRTSTPAQGNDTFFYATAGRLVHGTAEGSSNGVAACLLLAMTSTARNPAGWMSLAAAAALPGPASELGVGSFTVDQAIASGTVREGGVMANLLSAIQKDFGASAPTMRKQHLT